MTHGLSADRASTHRRKRLIFMRKYILYVRPTPPLQRLRHALRLCSGEGHDPIRLPSFAAIGGERLLEARGGWRDLVKAVSNQDTSFIEGILPIEFSASILELTEHSTGQHAGAAIGPIQIPLM
jgi:hypothetical protein